MSHYMIHNIMKYVINDYYKEDYDRYTAEDYYDNYCFQYTFSEWYFYIEKKRKIIQNISILLK